MAEGEILHFKRGTKGRDTKRCVGVYLSKERHDWFRKQGININATVVALIDKYLPMKKSRG